MAIEDVLLFYRDYETDKFLPGDRYLKRVVRPLYNQLHRRQKVTGFYVSFLMLVRALEEIGCRVRVNDYAFAAKFPRHPVGLVGSVKLIEDWDLPNPAVLGPTLYDHPALAPDLMKDPRFRLYLTLADWARAMFRKVYGDVCVPWYAGIDTEAWPDLSDRPKSVDVLIYDKIRWGHGVMTGRLIDPIIAALEARGRSWQIITYKDYDHARFRDRLAAARSMLFLCEHETQGLAYQEAMASNVPILAWDPGWWIDPQWAAFETEPVPATSVPFFSPECGARFTSPDQFTAAFDRFWAGLPRYRPRAYVERELSLKTSGALYLKYYRQVQDQVAAAA